MLQFFKKAREAREAAARALAENPEDSNSGKSFKQLYKVGDKLGQGAFSVVKEGTHKQSGKSFAIKIVNKYRLSENDLAALQDEIKFLKEFKHSHIVQLYDVFQWTDYYYLVTEKLTGGSLYDRIAQKGRYSEAEGRVACKTMFEALDYTHKHSVAHRDLKLENLLLVSPTDDTDLKLIDFGFAKKVTSENSLKTFIGTPGYVAPCILEGVGYGTQADIWSMGVIVYCMLGGYPPFRDPNRDKLFNKIRRGMYVFHESKWSDVSDEAKDFIDRLLTVDPSKRVTAEEALQHRWMIEDVDGDLKESDKSSIRSVTSLGMGLIPELPREEQVGEMSGPESQGMEIMAT